MLKKVIETIEKENLIEKKDKIVVAVSGGPDSVSMLHLLWSIRKTYDLTLYVCHLNHMLRGKDADDDALYVKELSDELDIKAYIFEEDIETFARENKMSFEEAARERRYALFETVKTETSSNKIAVAQNMNDQAETMLMRLFRGSGLEGLTSIKYTRDDIIRPLLNVSRDDIEAYCDVHQLKPRIDKTNYETDYTRNKIRLELIPYIKKHFNPKIVEGLYQTSQLLQSDLNFFDDYLDEIMSDMDINQIPINKLPKHGAIRNRLFRKMIEIHSGDLKGITFDLIGRLNSLVENRRHGSKILIKDITFEISYDDVIVYKNDVHQRIDPMDDFKFLDKPCEKGELITIDKDKVVGQLKIRHRLPGDKFKPLGMKGHKKLKDYFIDIKLPANKRDDVLLLCDDEAIIWVVGYRMNDDYKITNKTTNRLTILYEPT